MKRLILLLFLVTACQDRRPVVIDGSSPQTFEETTKAARRQLPDADRITFDRAIRTVGGRRLARRDVDALAQITFDGMTAEEVVADQQARDR